jgi:hypothetical protein
MMRSSVEQFCKNIQPAILFDHGFSIISPTGLETGSVGEASWLI